MQINKKVLIVICVVLIIILFMKLVINKNKNVENNNALNDTKKTNNGVLFDDETGLYYLKNEETGEIIYASKHEEELQVYIDNPDYNPNPLSPKRTTLEEYIIYPEEYSEEIIE